MLVVPTGQELGLGGVDSQTPEFVRVTLQRTTMQGLPETPQLTLGAMLCPLLWVLSGLTQGSCGSPGVG